MLEPFDWIRRCKSGSELLATLDSLDTDPGLFDGRDGPGPPITLFDRPCRRCWVYPPAGGAATLCKACRAVMAGNDRRKDDRAWSAAIWAHVNRLPAGLAGRTGFYADRIQGAFVRDERHFLLILERRRLKAWLQETLVYHGAALKGLFQVFPAVSGAGKRSMGEILCRAVQLDARFPMDVLRVRFYPKPNQLFFPKKRDQQGVLTFEVTAFLRLLEMSRVLRSLLRPDAQDLLRELLELKDKSEEQFYWGRFMGMLTPEARDMLEAWRIRTWARPQVQLLYEMFNYAEYSP